LALVAALAPHPGGLGRWSVMRAIRKSREAVAREIPLSFPKTISGNIDGEGHR
jgi:hypothetical protein